AARCAAYTTIEALRIHVDQVALALYGAELPIVQITRGADRPGGVLSGREHLSPARVVVRGVVRLRVGRPGGQVCTPGCGLVPGHIDGAVIGTARAVHADVGELVGPLPKITWARVRPGMIHGPDDLEGRERNPEVR